ncbi:MAG TPA: CRISPR-associated protein Cas4 [Chloroflexi bacterium]|nr:CRISPR-associated protein Cas4 [Chloroflexota bacterium]
MMERVEERELFRVTDLKEYIYCPRAFFYEACLPDLHRETVKTDAGRRAHERERQLARRRSLAAYGLEAGERFFDVPVRSDELRMVGEIDEVLRVEGELIPVDYKNTDRLGYNFQMQLTAYGLMLAETAGQEVRRGFFFIIPARRAEELVFSARLVRSVKHALSDMYRIVETEAMPEPTRYRMRCATCKYRRFCNDV